MLKVVLADDEKKVIVLLQKLIDWESLGYEIAGIANDGFRALELVEKLRPQLLITDIRMPGCDGIELIRKARELHPKIHFIVISGYSQFEYAQKALRYGVEDYLLKPLKKDEITGILLQIRDKLGVEAEVEYRLEKDKEKRQEEMLALLKKCAERSQPFLKKEQINTEFGFHFADGYYYTALVKPDISNASNHPDGYHLLMRHALTVVKKEIKSISDESAATVMREGIAVVIFCKEYQSVNVKQCFTKIRKEIEKQRELFWDIRVTVCMGSVQTETEQLTQSMRETLWLCKDRLCTKQTWRDAAFEIIDFDTRYVIDSGRKKQIQIAVEYLDAGKLEFELTESAHDLLNEKKLSGQMIQDWFCEMIRVCIFGMGQNEQLEENFLAEMEEKFWYCTSAQETAKLLIDKIYDMVLQINRENAVREAKPITEAKKYIQDNYLRELKLEDVSSAVGFNAAYFSTLFRKETGQTFTNYLTDLRIRKAKELLCEKDVSVSDVAELVGYKDLKYFSRLFKKVTGISPSDYKKLYR